MTYWYKKQNLVGYWYKQQNLVGYWCKQQYMLALYSYVDFNIVLQFDVMLGLDDMQAQLVCDLCNAYLYKWHFVPFIFAFGLLKVL